MKFNLKGIEYEYDGPTVWDNESFSVSTPNTAIMFTKEFIIDTIIEAQKNGSVKLKWVDEEKISINIEDCDFNLQELELYIDHLTGDLYMRDSVYVNIIPETVQEFEYYFRQLIDKEFNSTVKNAVSILPTWRCFVDYHSAKQVGDSLVLPAYQKFTNGYDRLGQRNSIDYWYILKIKNLSNSSIDVYAPKDLIPHLIGKGGKQIQEVKNLVHEAGYKQVKRINLTSIS